MRIGITLSTLEILAPTLGVTVPDLLTMADPMTLDSNHLVELAIATVGGLAAVGMVVLKFAMRGLEQQYNATRQLIEERFQWAEAQRQEARQHWEDHFTDLRKNDDRLSQHITQIETCVAAIEIHLNKNRA